MKVVNKMLPPKKTLWEILQEMPLKAFVEDEFQRWSSDSRKGMTQARVINDFLDTVAHHGQAKINSPEYRVVAKYVIENSDNLYKTYQKQWE